MSRVRAMSEDWLAFWLGIFAFVLALGPLVGLDLLGWVVKGPDLDGVLAVARPGL